MKSSKTAPPTTEPTDVAAWKELILWARRNGVLVHELTVGGVRGVITDAPRTQAPEKTDKDLRESLYAQYGGQVLDQAIMEVDKDAGDDGGDDEQD